jgi:hypothetical protein
MKTINRPAALALALAALVMANGAATAQQKASASVAAPPPAAAAAPAPGALAAPAADAMLMMIRTHVLAAGQAVQTGNYEVLRGIASSDFRAKNSADQLKTAFAQLAGLKLDMGPASVTTPVLSEPPVVTKEGTLRLMGVFPTRPVEIPFGLVFVAEGGAWKLGDMSLGARAAPAVAEVSMPVAAPAAASAPAAAKPAAKK